MAVLEIAIKIEEKTKGLQKLQGQLQDVGANLTKKVTLPILAAGAGVLKLAADAEKSKSRFNRAFESMGAAAWTSAEALEANVQALQDASTFGDEAIRDAAGTLLTFANVTEESFDRGLQAAVDMAAFFDQDLQSSVIQVGKALDDPKQGLGALKRIGVSFSEEQRKIIAGMVEIGDVAGAQAVILEALEEQVGGAAYAEAATSMGQMEQAMHKLSDAGESIGVILLPILAEAAGIIKGLAEWFISLDDGVKRIIVTVAGFAAVIGPVLWIGGALIGVLIKLSGIILGIPTVIGHVIFAFGKVGAAFKVLSALLLANPFVALAAAVVALVALIVLNWDKIVAVFKGAMRFMGEVGDKLWTPLGIGFKAAIDFIKGVWNTFVDWWNGISISVPSVDIPLVGVVGGFSIGLPKLPRLAEGGIVTGPTLALIGERGPEAVVPLDRGGYGTVNHFTFNLEGDPIEDEERVVDLITRAQRLQERLAWQ